MITVGYPKIKGNLEIILLEESDENEEWDVISIHGDPDGLRSLAAILNRNEGQNG